MIQGPDNELEEGTSPADPALPRPFGSATSLGGVGVLFTMMLMGMMLVGGVAQFFLGFVANAILTELLVILAPIAFLLRRRDPVAQLGLSRLPRAGQVTWAILGVLSLAVLLAEFSHWSDRVFPMPEAVKAAYLEAVTPDTALELCLLLVAAALVPGLCEEVAFRGFFQRVGVERFGKARGIAMASALFALMHLDPWHLAALFLIGMYLGWVYAWTENLWVAALAHAANNAASVLLLFLAPGAALSQLSEPPPRALLPVAALGLWLALRQLRGLSRGPAPSGTGTHSAE